MANWTGPDPNRLLPGEPWTSDLALAAFEDPVAIAEGSAGAPRVELPAIVDALAAVPAGSVGSYVWARLGDVNVGYGATVAGSALNPTSGFWGGATKNSVVGDLAGSLSGTWRCMGRNTVDKLVLDDPDRYARFATLWLRIV